MAGDQRDDTRVFEITQAGQSELAAAVLNDARRKLYQLLADA